LVNTEAKLRQVFDKLAKHGPVLVVVDQPPSIGALPDAVARAGGQQVAYLPGLAMRLIADLHPGSAKTDARDAYVIADAARPMPHTLRRVDVGDEALAELEVLVGFDDDLAGEATRLTNRIRGLLTQVKPGVGTSSRQQHPAQSSPGTAVMLRWPSRAAQGRPPQTALDRQQERTTHGRTLVERIMAALDEQTVIVPGTAPAATILPRLAGSLRDVLQQRDQVAAEVDRMLDAHPLAAVLTQLERAFFLAAFAALADPVSRAYYDRKRAQGKRHNAALICLARRRVDVLFAMLRDKTPYQSRVA
jgi:transposase